MSDVETLHNDTLDEVVHRCTLPQGLSVYFCPKSEFQKKYACYSTFYGSVDNCFKGVGEPKPAPVGVPNRSNG